MLYKQTSLPCSALYAKCLLCTRIFFKSGGRVWVTTPDTTAKVPFSRVFTTPWPYMASRFWRKPQKGGKPQRWRQYLQNDVSWSPGDAWTPRGRAAAHKACASSMGGMRDRANKTPILSSRLIRRLRLRFCAKLTQPGSATCCSGSRRVLPGVLWG